MNFKILTSFVLIFSLITGNEIIFSKNAFANDWDEFQHWFDGETSADDLDPEFVVSGMGAAILGQGARLYMSQRLYRIEAEAFRNALATSDQIPDMSLFSNLPLNKRSSGPVPWTVLRTIRDQKKNVEIVLDFVFGQSEGEGVHQFVTALTEKKPSFPNLLDVSANETTFLGNSGTELKITISDIIVDGKEIEFIKKVMKEKGLSPKKMLRGGVTVRHVGFSRAITSDAHKMTQQIARKAAASRGIWTKVGNAVSLLGLGVVGIECLDYYITTRDHEEEAGPQ